MDLFLFSNIRGTFFTGLKYYLNSRFVSMSLSFIYDISVDAC